MHMRQYLNACRTILCDGVEKGNRNGGTLSVHGMMMKFDLQEGFPAVTTKKLQFKSVVAELLGFIRGASNAKTFKELGTGIWDANATSDYWSANPNNKGDGDLGRIYGVQARGWRAPNSLNIPDIDQLDIMVHKLLDRVDDRRNIVLHWNPGELDQMSLPACHIMYQCHLRGSEMRTLDMTMYQRSCDFPLGVPFNVASYALLMHIFCRIANLKPGVLTWMGGDCHIYQNQVGTMHQQVCRKPKPLPGISIHPSLKTLEDFENATEDQFTLTEYEHHNDIQHAFSV